MTQYVTTVSALTSASDLLLGAVANSFGLYHTGYSIYPGALGTIAPATLAGATVQAALNLKPGSPYEIMLQLSGSSVTTGTFTSATFINGGTATTFAQSAASFFPAGTSVLGVTVPLTTGNIWVWSGAHEFYDTSGTTIILTNPTPTAPAGKGDIVDPEAWQDSFGNIPPTEFSNVPYNVNFPLNGDGRYWFSANAFSTNTSGPITFIGNPNYLIDTASLQWSVVSTANDGSGLLLAYTADGSTWTTTTLLPQTQLGGIQNGAIPVNLLTTGTFQIQVYASGGTPNSAATLSEVAIAITRNENETLSWDNPNPFDPINYNGLVADTVVPTATLSSLRQRILIRLGFSNQATNPPPGMAALVNDFLTSAQTFLYRRYLQLHTKRLFRWKINPGQRWYSLKDNDENVLEGVNMDPMKCVEWVGIQDSRNVWYPMIQGIPPQLYTMVTKPWRPARYEIKNAIEIYPAPDQTYWLWVKGHFGLMSFTLDTQTTTIDSELVFLHALANAKAHYGQPDANNIESQANAYRAELIAATHQTAHYLPGTIAVPPAVRPTLIQFDANNGGGS